MAEARAAPQAVAARVVTSAAAGAAPWVSVGERAAAAAAARAAAAGSGAWATAPVTAAAAAAALAAPAAGTAAAAARAWGPLADLCPPQILEDHCCCCCCLGSQPEAAGPAARQPRELDAGRPEQRPLPIRLRPPKPGTAAAPPAPAVGLATARPTAAPGRGAQCRRHSPPPRAAPEERGRATGSPGGAAPREAGAPAARPRPPGAPPRCGRSGRPRPPRRRRGGRNCTSLS
mmetsp:Transcript_71296/g.220046  ORF Transcript_71296/g.220046 Transcript_71296/m.220046 type:complete len:232 (-) Transcript_71296:173-868(-)